MAHARILIVEDEPIISLNIEARMKYLGYEVAAVTPSGEDAIRQAAALQPDLVLMDIHLAGDLDGVETARQIHASCDIPVIYLTSDTDDETVQRAKFSEPFGYLTKPFSERELHSTIEIALYKHQVERERRVLEVQRRQTQKIEAIGILASGVAHDFNNILGTILGYTELLLGEFPDGAREKDYLEHIYTAGERGADLVRQILTFSRSQEQKLTPIRIAPLIQESLKLMQATIPANIGISQSIQPDCPCIMADATQIHQVIINLCTNAVQAMRAKGGILDVRLDAMTHDPAQEEIPGLAAGAYLKFAVSDTGAGMTSEVQERIFEPFFTTKAIGEGNGLGLSVVHGIVKGHHAIITVKSTPGQGAAFSIFFPVTEAPEAPAERSGVMLPTGKRGAVLIVEDERALADVYAVALTKLGYSAAVCHTGQDALDLFRADPQRFDVVFTDQDIPNMTGVQLSRELRRLKPALPIILTTGYQDSLSAQESAEHGICHILKKPVKILTLIQVIQQTLK